MGLQTWFVKEMWKSGTLREKSGHSGGSFEDSANKSADCEGLTHKISEENMDNIGIWASDQLCYILSKNPGFNLPVSQEPE